MIFCTIVLFAIATAILFLRKWWAVAISFIFYVSTLICLLESILFIT